MQRQRIVLGIALAIGATAALGPVSAQENRGTWEQQMACTPDVWRLCSDMVPDVNRIVGCLRQNTSQLSGNCRAVFDGGEQQQAYRAPPRGSQQMRRSQQQYQPQMAPPQIAPPPRPGYDDWDD